MYNVKHYYNQRKVRVKLHSHVPCSWNQTEAFLQARAGQPGESRRCCWWCVSRVRACLRILPVPSQQQSGFLLCLYHYCVHLYYYVYIYTHSISIRICTVNVFLVNWAHNLKLRASFIYSLKQLSLCCKHNDVMAVWSCSTTVGRSHISAFPVEIVHKHCILNTDFWTCVLLKECLGLVSILPPYPEQPSARVSSSTTGLDWNRGSVRCGTAPLWLESCTWHMFMSTWCGEFSWRMNVCTEIVPLQRISTHKRLKIVMKPGNLGYVWWGMLPLTRDDIVMIFTNFPA